MSWAVAATSLLAATSLAGCSGVEHRAVDLQLDLPGAPPADAEQVRFCVAGVGERVAGARFTGRFVFTGLPAGRAADVVVDALDGEGEVLAQWSGTQVWGYDEGEMSDCSLDSGAPLCAPCEATGGLAEGDTWVLGLRFLGAESG